MQSAFRFVAPVLARLPIVVNLRAFSLSEAIRAAGSAHPFGSWHPPTPTCRHARPRPSTLRSHGFGGRSNSAGNGSATAAPPATTARRPVADRWNLPKEQPQEASPPGLKPVGARTPIPLPEPPAAKCGPSPARLPARFRPARPGKSRRRPGSRAPGGRWRCSARRRPK